MNRALLVVLVGACTDATELRVYTSANGVYVDAYDAFCACERQTPPTLGHCRRFTDVRTGDECDCSKRCVSSLRVERDGVVVATTKGDILSGDFLGTSLVVGGCGGDVVVPLPASTPPQPTITSITPIDGGSSAQITWVSPPPVDLVEVRWGTLAGQTCVVAPEPSTITTSSGVSAGGNQSEELRAIQVMPIIELDAFRVRTYATSAAPKFQM